MRSIPMPVPPDGRRLLVAALRGEPSAWTQLVERFSPLLLRAARLHARDLPSALHAEVVQETLLTLTRWDEARFERSRLPVSGFLLSPVRNAAAKVRSAYRAPGCRSRTRRGIRPESCATGVPESLVCPVAAREQRRTEARLDVERLMRRADPVVARAMAHVLAGASFREAARAVGLTHTALLRGLRDLGRE
jgi:hypothetical protein